MAFVVVCCVAVTSASRLPFLDLPEELLMDVNKAYGALSPWSFLTLACCLLLVSPHPIVNIIADQAADLFLYQNSL